MHISCYHELQQIPPGCQWKLNGSTPLGKASPAVYTQFQKKNVVINGGDQYHHTKSERSHFGNNQKNSNGINLLKMVLARDGSNVKKPSGADYCIQIYNVMYKLRNLPFYILV